MLAQYDTPDAILAHPADEFVKQFIGEDRALRRLALRTLADVQLTAGAATGRACRCRRRVRNAVSLMLERRPEQVVVTGDDGAALGSPARRRTGLL